MSRKNFTPEQVIRKLIEADVLVSKGEAILQVKDRSLIGNILP